MQCVLLDLYLQYYCTNMFILDMAVGMFKGWDARVEHVACFCEHNIESLGSIKCKEFFNQLWNC